MVVILAAFWLAYSRFLLPMTERLEQVGWLLLLIATLSSQLAVKQPDWQHCLLSAGVAIVKHSSSPLFQFEQQSSAHSPNHSAGSHELHVGDVDLCDCILACLDTSPVSHMDENLTFPNFTWMHRCMLAANTEAICC